MDDYFVLPQSQKFDDVKDLLDRARFHFPLASMAERLTPFEFMLLSMVIEQRKEIKQLKEKAEGISSKLKDVILQ